MGSENHDATVRNVALRSAHPFPENFAPNSVTGSFCDHRASRGSTSPAWIALSAATCFGSISARKSSTAVPMTPPIQLHYVQYSEDVSNGCNCQEAIRLDPATAAGARDAAADHPGCERPVLAQRVRT